MIKLSSASALIQSGLRRSAATLATVTTGELERDDVSDAAGTLARATATKVPEITAYFWITKVLTTGMGEAT